MNLVHTPLVQDLNKFQLIPSTIKTTLTPCVHYQTTLTPCVHYQTTLTLCAHKQTTLTLATQGSINPLWPNIVRVERVTCVRVVSIFDVIAYTDVCPLHMQCMCNVFNKCYVHKWLSITRSRKGSWLLWVTHRSVYTAYTNITRQICTVKQNLYTYENVPKEKHHECTRTHRYTTNRSRPIHKRTTSEITADSWLCTSF